VGIGGKDFLDVVVEHDRGIKGTLYLIREKIPGNRTINLSNALLP
jgi:hypothetical protein